MNLETLDCAVFVNGETLAYRHTKAPYVGAPRLLALHGWLDNLASFTPLLGGLGADFEVVCLDLPGHGHSSHRGPTDKYHAVDWLPAVMGLLRHLGWARCALLGHSMGSAIATLAAGTAPSCFWGLVALDLLGPQAISPEQLPEILQTRMGPANEQKWKRAARPYRSPGAAARTLSRAVPNLSFANALLLTERGMRETPEGFVWRADKRLRAQQLSLLTEPQIESFLRRIACPVLFLRALDGLALCEVKLRRRMEYLARGQREDLYGGHHLHMERSEAVLRLILPFLCGAAKSV